MYQLQAPIVSKSIITKDHYSTLPTFLQPHVANYDHIWFVIIVPQATVDPNDPCRVVVSAAANNRTGNLRLENNGRLPVSPPPDGFDDLRPASFYAWDVGSQTFRVRVTNNSAVYVETRVDFE